MFFERPEAGTNALLVHIEAEDATVEELRELAVSAGLEPVAELTAKKRNPDPKTYIGSGKLDEIHKKADLAEAELILFDQELSPTQERNLEEILGRRVLGRTGLILNIFAKRARTHEGKLQVELAQLQHASTRLVRGWTHLDRQRGGSGRGQGAAIGVTGAGETQLEADQRLISSRIKTVNQRLMRVRKQRHQNRRARQKAGIRTVSLVGYTNAGKSTLFNALCDSKVHAADQLFATLDPTMRQLELPVLGKVILTDTVGFIRQLPHGLIEAFRATLEEVEQAALLLHVVDASAPERSLHMQEVNNVLVEIGADKVPQLLVYNKIDLLNEKPRIDRNAFGQPVRVWLSGIEEQGLENLLVAITELVASRIVDITLRLAPRFGQMRAQLYALGAVISEKTEQDGTLNLHVRLEAKRLKRIARQARLDISDLGLDELKTDKWERFG